MIFVTGMKESGYDSLKNNQDKKISKWPMRLVWAFVIANLLFALNHVISIYAPPVDPSKVHKYREAAGKSTTKHIRIDGVDYDIPIGYFSRYVPSYTEVSGVLLWTLYPEFGVPNVTRTDVFHSDRRFDETRLLAKAKIHNPGRLQKALDHHLEKSPYMPSDIEMYGLLTFSLPEGIYNEGDIPFVQRDSNENLTTYIRCSVDTIQGYKGKRFPQCVHHFESDNLFLQASYNKKHLPNWKRIEDSWQALIKSFQKSAEQQNRINKIILPSQVDPQLIKLKTYTYKPNHKGEN